MKHNTEFLQSNGFVETAIEISKKTLQKCRKDDSNSYLAMLVLRTTRNSSGTSTSKLLKKGRLQTPVPC